MVYNDEQTKWKKNECAHLYLGAEGAAGTDNECIGAVGTTGLLAITSNNLKDSFYSPRDHDSW